ASCRADTPEPVVEAPATGSGSSSHAETEAGPNAPQASGVPVEKARFLFSATNFPNHDGGIVGWAGDLADVWQQGLVNEVTAGYPVMRAQINLENFISRDLTSAYLGELDSGFAAVRSVGAKVIVRFLYSSPISFDGSPVPDASISQTLRHIAQLGPVLNRNADVIMAMEAGFVGAWGEWHASASGLDSPTNKALIKDALLEAVPANRQVLFRYPVDVSRWYPTPVSAADAGTLKA